MGNRMSLNNKPWPDDMREEFIERYPTDTYDELLADFPLKSKRSLQGKASNLRSKGYDVPARRIADRAQLDKRPKLGLSQCEKIDLARMIDTDGWISSTSNRSVRVGFSNKNEKLIAHFEELSRLATRDGGRKRTAQTARQWQVTVHGLTKVYSVLENVKPYLIAKQEQANVAMEFIETRCTTLQSSSYHDGELNLTDEEALLIDRLGELNALGPQ